MTDGDFFDSNGKLASYSNSIWNRVSEALEGKITPQTLYISVYKNCHSWQTKLREKFGKTEKTLCSPQSSVDSSTEISDTDDVSDHDIDSKHFTFDIPYNEFLKMYPVEVQYGKNKKNILY